MVEKLSETHFEAFWVFYCHKTLTILDNVHLKLLEYKLPTVLHVINFNTFNVS